MNTVRSSFSPAAAQMNRPLLERNSDDDHPQHVTSFDCGDRFRTIGVWHDTLRTNVLVLPATTSVPRHRLLLIVGNPGVCEFYYDFATALHQLQNGALEIVVASHLGHCGRSTAGAVFALKSQIAHKRHLLQALLGEADDSARVMRELRLPFAHTALPLMLAGHSIGAYICLKLTHERGEHDARIAHVFSLFPTFRDLYAGLARFAQIAVLPGVRQMFAFVLGYCPLRLTHWLLHLSHEMTDESKYATADKLSYDFVNNILFMAYTEVQEVTTTPADIEETFARDASRQRLHFLYSPIDPYTPPSFPDDLKRQHPHLSSRVQITGDKVRHAFVLSNSVEVAQSLHQLIESLSN